MIPILLGLFTISAILIMTYSIYNLIQLNIRSSSAFDSKKYYYQEREKERWAPYYQPQENALRYLKQREKSDKHIKKFQPVKATQETFKAFKDKSIEYTMVYQCTFMYRQSVTGQIIINEKNSKSKACHTLWYSKEELQKRIEQPYKLLFYYYSFYDNGQIKIACHFEE